MGADEFEFVRFRQRFRTRPQRQRLGIDMDQERAMQVLEDERALRAEYEAWLAREGRGGRRAR